MELKEAVRVARTLLDSAKRGFPVDHEANDLCKTDIEGAYDRLAGLHTQLNCKLEDFLEGD